MKRRRRKSEMEGPEVPVAPMLDMAFQLLTFFVLTYRAAPVEGQFIMNLLPPQPATAMAAAAADAAPAAADLPVSLRTLPVVLRAAPGGALARVTIADQEVPNEQEALERELDRYFLDPDAPFDQTLLTIDPNLRYSELMTVIDAFTNAFAKAKKEPKLSFDELRGDDGG